MKRLIVLLACLMMAGSAFAMPGKTELTLAGALVNVSNGPNVWFVTSDLLFPIGSGHVILGPSFTFGSARATENAGLGVEWNITGQKNGGLFIGATANYFTNEPDSSEIPTTVEVPENLDDYAVTARAGFKFNIGKGALLKLYAAQIVDGRGANGSNITANIGIGAKF